jgi:NADH-quinone oxidoreductase subunit J
MFTPLHIIFYIFAAIAVGSAVNVITSTNPVRSVLSLVITFFATAGIWMLLHAEFLSIILVLVYVGAVMTLFLFVVMMLNIKTEARTSGFVRYWPFGILVALLVTGVLFVIVGPQNFGLDHFPAPVNSDADYSNLKQLGDVLYTDYVYPFEIAGLLLLAAIIAAITLTYRGPRQRKVQNPAKQIDIDPKNRVRLVNMPSERPKEEGSQ